MIGRGKFGIVRLASNQNIPNKQFAIKQMPISQQLLAKSEVNLLFKLDHPNIVKLIETFQTDQHHNLVMEYYQGGSLSERV
mmetsp:Transcript_1045/g.121  ORF Transcript_1045/g.121 Transcript_1045/m.121 type:complete len:81 (+) Transcript_1045:51-293(+)